MKRLAIALVCLTFAMACDKTAPPAASGQATASASATSEPPEIATSAPPETHAAGDDDELVVSSEVAARLGASGFRMKGLRGHGWSRSEPSEATLARLSGPPGGPLGFEVRAYTEPAVIEKLFTELVQHRPLHVGAVERVPMAAAEREAQSFRTGESLATTNWCVIKLPPAEGARAGLLVLIETSSGEGAEPSCERSLQRDAIQPLVASFRLD